MDSDHTPQCHLIAGTCTHSQRWGVFLHQAAAFLSPWRGGDGEKRGGLPSPGEPPSSCSPTQAGSGQRQPHMLLPSGNFPPGAPPGPGEGVRSASEKKPARGRNPPPGWASLETEACQLLGSRLGSLRAAAEGPGWGASWAAPHQHGNHSGVSQGSLAETLP